MTSEQWCIHVEGDGDAARLLAIWLENEDDLRARIRLAGAVPEPERLGQLTDMIMLTIAPGAAVAVLIESVFGWMRSATSDLTVRIRRADGTEVEVRASRLRRLSAAEVPAEVERLTRAVGGTDTVDE
jgi:hypothetical protein